MLGNLCKILISFALFSAVDTFLSRRRPNVATKLGEIRGRRLIDCGNWRVDGFYAIPYAKAPIGELRFKKPEAHEPWTVPLNATEFGPRCAQNPMFEAGVYEGDALPMSEDCLFLNIFAPAWGSHSAFPVMMWLHGGGYTFGSSNEYGDTGIAEHLVTKGVIVVTINYRLGPYGFFTTGDDQCPGNFGLWDQSLALHWIKEHIASFNGDPNKITVFGQSAGGSSADWLSLSPYSRDVFDQAIEMSGSCSAPWASVDSKSHSSALAAQLKCPTKPSKAVVDCVRNKSIHEIYEAMKIIGPTATDLNLLKFTPVIDGDFLPDNIEQLRKEAPKKRVIAGTTEREGGLMTINPGAGESKYYSRPDFGVSDLQQFLEELLPETKYRNFELLRILAAYEYLRDGDPKNHTFIIEKHLQAFSDFLFNVPLYNDVQNMVKNDWTVYLYSFDYANPEAFAENNPVKKAYHFMEAPYLFDKIWIRPYKFNGEDRKMLKTFTRLFTNFAKFGYLIQMERKGKTGVR